MKKKIYIQILGVIACLAVVAMHVNGCFWQFSYDRYWITANIIECICYFAVPIFFMISGATLLNYRKRYTTAVFFKKRFGKTLVPFLIWSVISAIWYYIVYHARPEGIREVVDGILNTRYVDIYWFFPALFSVYLCIPILSCIPEKYRKRIFGYAILVYFVLEALAPLVCNLMHIEFNEGFGMPAVGGYLIYTLLGYWIDNYELSKKWRCVIYAAALGGFLLMLVGTQILSLKNGTVDTTFKEYRNVPCILYSTGIFLFFKNIKNEKGVGLPCKTDRTIFIVDFWYISGTLLFSTDGGNLSDISNHQHQVPDLWNDCNLPDLRCGSQNPADDSGHQESDSILIRCEIRCNGILECKGTRNCERKSLRVHVSKWRNKT